MGRELRVIGNKPRQPKPEWLKIRLGDPTNQNHVLKLIEGLNLHTVCQEARCPNIFECWTDRTATFMLGGDICTRHCGFCAVGGCDAGGEAVGVSGGDCACVGERCVDGCYVDDKKHKRSFKAEAS